MAEVSGGFGTVGEFEGDLTLDASALDLECLKQPEVFWKWSQRLVSARKELDTLELALEVTEAKLLAKVRKAPESFGLEKATDAGVKAAVAGHPKILKARQAVLAAKGRSLLLEKAVAALEQRKRSLENLVALHGQQYFAEPSQRGGLATRWEKFKKGGTARQRELVRKTKD